METLKEKIIEILKRNLQSPLIDYNINLDEIADQILEKPKEELAEKIENIINEIPDLKTKDFDEVMEKILKLL